MALSIIAPNIEHMLIIMSNILRVNMLEKSYILKDVIHKFLVNNPPTSLLIPQLQRLRRNKAIVFFPK
jgi:hypothetical protein